MLPKSQDDPPILPKTLRVSGIALSIHVQLRIPVLQIRLRAASIAARGTSVPEATVDKYGNLLSQKNDVRTTRKLRVHAITSQPACPDHLSQTQLWLCVPRTDSGHVVRPSGVIVNVHRSTHGRRSCTPKTFRYTEGMATVFEICAGAGGQAIGLERAGFECLAAVELDRHACETLRTNRPEWNVIEADVRTVDATAFRGVDLLAGGVPCPPFSVAGKQLGSNDERDLFPEAIRLAEQLQPRAVMLENVPGFASEKFREYRRGLFAKLRRLGYIADYRILNACEFGVPQLRPRCIIVALRAEDAAYFRWPEGNAADAPVVGDTLCDLMAENGWRGVAKWTKKANGIAPTIVGGSKKHGGPDLGPTRARARWAQLGVDGLGISDQAPTPDFPAAAMPKLTVRMVARIQGFPDEWQFAGKKTASYRQVGNAFPPPVAEAVGTAIRRALASVYEAPHDREQMRIFDGPDAASL
jgi:DNA (cytosine-5)-methyltransferase 1